MIALREDLLVVFQLAFSTQQFSEDVVSEQFLRILAVATHPIHHHGFDEENAGIHTSPLNVDVIALIC